MTAGGGKEERCDDAKKQSKVKMVLMPALHLAARAGHEGQVRYLVEHERSDVNEIDSWDSSALYYAVYGGHIAIVRYLLEHGAIADPWTFIGERCYYGALNDDIRKLLREHNARDFSVAAKHFFVRFLRTLSRRTELHDFCFATTNEDSYTYPRLVLGLRSPSLCRKLVTQWLVKSKVQLRKHQPSQDAVLRYLCTGRLVIQRKDVSTVRSMLNSLEITTPSLLTALETARAENELNSTRTQKSEQHFERGAFIFEDEIQLLREHFIPLAEYASTPRPRQSENIPGDDSVLSSLFCSCCDLELRCSDGLTLQVPSIFLRAHSDFIDAALRESSGFSEFQSKSLDLFDANSFAAAAIVRWCCCGATPPELNHDPASAAQLIETSHRLLMPSELIGAGASALVEALNDLATHDPQAALDTLSLAQLLDDEYGNDKLYTAVIGVCARNLDAALSLNDFKQAVLVSAESIQKRQDTDSIPLIDDIRSALMSAINPLELDPSTSPEGQEEARCMQQIDNYLGAIGLRG